MKTLIYSVLFSLFIFSCKKQALDFLPLPTAPSTDSISAQYLKNVRSYLKENLEDSAYRAINWNHVLLSKEETGWYLQLGYGSQPVTERFLLLTTDSLGRVSDSRDIKLNKNPLVDYTFDGTIEINNLQGKLISTSTVSNGYVINDRVRQPGNISENSTEEMLLPAYPVEELPEVIVVGYTDGGGGGGLSLGDYIMLSGLSGGGSASGGGGSSGSAGGSSGGGSSSSGSGSASSPVNSAQYTLLRPAGSGTSPVTRITINRPTTITVDESYTKPEINVAAYLKCFSAIPDAGASYAVSLYVDLPINDDPTQVFNQATGAVGHCFLGLTKSGGGRSVTQYLGFASTQAIAAIAGVVTSGKVVDNGGHKYNASLSIPVSATQFSVATNQITALSGSNYDLNSFNCVDFSLSVINNFQPTTPIIPAVVQMPAGGLSMDTPQGLYLTLQQIQNTGGAALVGSIWNAGNSHGACN